MPRKMSSGSEVRSWQVSKLPQVLYLLDDLTCSTPNKTIRMEVDSPPLILPAFSAETLKLRNLLDLHPNSVLKMSYALNVAEFAQWLVGKKNVKQKKGERGKKKTKATLSASFDLKTVSLLHSGLKGKEKESNTSGRKCLLFRNVI